MGIQDISAAIISAELSLANVASEQATIQQILRDENSRLASKQASIQTTSDTQARTVAMNQNFSKRYTEYMYMMSVVIIGLLVILMYKFLTSIYPLPDGVGTVLYILVITTVVVICVQTYMTIMSRDPNDFDKLSLPPPVGMGAGSTTGVSTLLSKSTGSGGIGSCTGAGVTWDAVTGCQPSFGTSLIKQAFTQRGNEYSDFSTSLSYATYP